MTFWVLTFIAEMLEVKGTLYFFDTFMEKRDGGYRNRYRFFVYCGVLYLVAVTGAWIGMLKCIPIILVMSFLNRNVKAVFSFLLSSHFIRQNARISFFTFVLIGLYAV